MPCTILLFAIDFPRFAFSFLHDGIVKDTYPDFPIPSLLLSVNGLPMTDSIDYFEDVQPHLRGRPLELVVKPALSSSAAGLLDNIQLPAFGAAGAAVGAAFGANVKSLFGRQEQVENGDSGAPASTPVIVPTIRGPPGDNPGSSIFTGLAKAVGNMDFFRPDESPPESSRSEKHLFGEEIVPTIVGPPPPLSGGSHPVNKGGLGVRGSPRGPPFTSAAELDQSPPDLPTRDSTSSTVPRLEVPAPLAPPSAPAPLVPPRPPAGAALAAERASLAVAVLESPSVDDIFSDDLKLASPPDSEPRDREFPVDVPGADTGEYAQWSSGGSSGVLSQEVSKSSTGGSIIKTSQPLAAVGSRQPPSIPAAVPQVTTTTSSSADMAVVQPPWSPAIPASSSSPPSKELPGVVARPHSTSPPSDHSGPALSAQGSSYQPTPPAPTSTRLHSSSAPSRPDPGDPTRTSTAAPTNVRTPAQEDPPPPEDYYSFSATIFADGPLGLEFHPLVRENEEELPKIFVKTVYSAAELPDSATKTLGVRVGDELTHVNNGVAAFDSLNALTEVLNTMRPIICTFRRRSDHAGVPALGGFLSSGGGMSSKSSAGGEQGEVSGDTSRKRTRSRDGGPPAGAVGSQSPLKKSPVDEPKEMEILRQKLRLADSVAAHWEAEATKGHEKLVQLTTQ